MVKYASFTFVSRIFARFAQLLLLILVARLLSVDEFAAYSYIVVVALTFSVLADTGVPLVASREIASGREDVRATFWSSVPIVLGGAGIAAAALVVFGLFDSGPGTSGEPLLLAAAYAATNTLFNFCATTMRGLGLFKAEALLQGGGALCMVTVGALVVTLDAGVEALLAVLVAKEGASLMIAGGMITHAVGHPARAHPRLWRRLLRSGIHLSLSSTALILVTRVPLILLANSGSKHAVAWFSAPLRMADAILVLGMTAGYSLFPGLSALEPVDPMRARRLLFRAIKFGGVGSVALAAILVVFADPIVPLLFGRTFEASVSCARVLFLGVPAYALLGLGWFALLASGEERKVLAYGAGAVGIALGLGLALIPPMSDVGAAWAYTGSVTALAFVTVTATIRRVAHVCRSVPQ